jgi:hypothetical protein
LIHTPGEAFESRDSVAVIPVQPDTASVTIPDAHLLFTAEFKRKRSDLVLTGDDGHKILVPDYFRHDKQPDLVSPEGALLSASLVELLSGSARLANMLRRPRRSRSSRSGASKPSAGRRRSRATASPST